MKIKPVTEEMMSMRLGPTMDMRVPTEGMRGQGQSSLYDALGAELKRQERVRDLRTKHGNPRHKPASDVFFPKGQY